MNVAKKVNAHIWEHQTDGHYVEPSWCSRRLFEEEEFKGDIWDPCCGFGTIPEMARARGLSVLASDIVNRGYVHLNWLANFLSCDEEQYGLTRNIVCNPPFHLVPEFAAHALKLAGKVAMIFPVARLNAAHWIKGTPLKTIWLMTPRPSMPPGHVIAAGEKPGGGKTDYCWLVWERGYELTPAIKWLRRDGDVK